MCNIIKDSGVVIGFIIIYLLDVVTVANCEIGICVGRGKDWIWGSRDIVNGHGPSWGRITDCPHKGCTSRCMSSIDWESGYGGRGYFVTAEGSTKEYIKRRKCSKGSYYNFNVQYDVFIELAALW